MHVGLVVYGSLANTSGGFLYDRQLVQHLRDVDASVDVFELSWRSYPRHLLDNLNAGLADRLLEAQPDVLLQDELCHPSLFRLNRRFSDEIPVVTIVHHLRTSEAHPPPASWLYRQVERRYLRTVDGVISSSRATRSAVDGMADIERSAVVPPGTGRFEPDIGPEDIETRAHDGGPLRVLFVGSLVPRKGADTLLDGLAPLADDDWRLTLIGDGSVAPDYADSLRRQVDRLGVGDRVRFTGPLPKAGLAAELSGGHVLAMPSRHEGFGVAYLEGMGFGLPPVATTSGGASELVSDGENGWLVPPDDPGAIVRALRPVLFDRARLARLGQAARERYLAHPSWTDTMERARTFLEQVANA